MIGRITDSTVTVGGVGTAPIFADLLDSLSKNSQITIKQDPAGYGPSDHSAFYTKDIPVLFFFSGFHGDYHLPEMIGNTSMHEVKNKYLILPMR